MARHVIAYQRDDADYLDYIPIPEGFEVQADNRINGVDEPIKFVIKLKKNEIKGIFSETEFRKLKNILFEVPAGGKSTELGEDG